MFGSSGFIGFREKVADLVLVRADDVGGDEDDDDDDSVELFVVAFLILSLGRDILLFLSLPSICQLVSLLVLLVVSSC